MKKIDQLVHFSDRVTKYYAQKLYISLRMNGSNYRRDPDSILFYAYVANVVEKRVTPYLMDQEQTEFLAGFTAMFDKEINNHRNPAIDNNIEKKEQWFRKIDLLCDMLDKMSVEDYASTEAIGGYLFKQGQPLNDDSLMQLEGSLFYIDQKINKIFSKMFKDSLVLDDLNESVFKMPMDETDQTRASSQDKGKVRNKAEKKAKKGFSTGLIIFIVFTVIRIISGISVDEDTSDRESTEKAVQIEEISIDQVAQLQGQRLTIDLFDYNIDFGPEWDIMTDNEYMNEYRLSDPEYYVYEFDLNQDYMDSFIGYNIDNYDIVIIDVINYGEGYDLKAYVEEQKEYFNGLDYFTSISQVDSSIVKGNKFYNYIAFVEEGGENIFSAKYAYAEKDGYYLQISMFSYYDLPGLIEFMEN